MVKYQPYLNLFSNKTDNSDSVIGNAPVLEMGRYRFESYSEFKKNNVMQELPIENIKEVFWVDGKIYIIYADGSKLTSNAKEIKLISGYSNDNEIPLNDHCL